MAKRKRKSITGIRKRAPKDTQKARRTPPDTHGELPAVWERTDPRRGGLLADFTDRKQQPQRVNKSSRGRPPRRQLIATVKHVPQAVIQSKWSPLDPSSQAKVQGLFQSIGMPVLAQQTKESHKIEAQDAIALVVGSLNRRLPKMPFPSSTKASHFDYDTLVTSNREAAQRLQTVKDSISLLKADLDDTTQQIEREQQELDDLENDISQHKATNIELPPWDETIKRDDTPNAIGLITGPDD